MACNSQGSALMEHAIEKVGKEIQDEIAGVIFFGYTRNGETFAGIPGFPKDKLKVFCNLSDGVCYDAGPIVTAGHLTYAFNGDIGQAVSFLAGKINAAGGVN